MADAKDINSSDDEDQSPRKTNQDNNNPDSPVKRDDSKSIHSKIPGIGSFFSKPKEPKDSKDVVQIDQADDKSSPNSPKEKKDGNDDAPSKPRRRRNNNNSENASNDGGGWMNNNSTGDEKRARAVASAVNLEEEVANAKDAIAPQVSKNKSKHFQDDNEEIVLIPDLEDDGGGDSDQRIAHAPRNVHRKIPTLAELEQEAKAALPATEDGLKLNCLVNTLVPLSMLYEPDVPWTFESLLREITDELSDVPKPVNLTNPPPVPSTNTPVPSSNKTKSSSSSSTSNANKKK